MNSTDIFASTPTLTLDDLGAELATEKEFVAPNEALEKANAAAEIADEEARKQAEAEAHAAKESQYLNYSEGEYFTAKLFLVQIDRILAFSFSLLSGKDMDTYRLRKEEVKGEDYEAKLLAALIKKYQMQLSLEMMFISAIVMAYAPMFSKAMSDRKEALKKQALEDQRAFMEWQRQQLQQNQTPTYAAKTA